MPGPGQLAFNAGRGYLETVRLLDRVRRVENRVDGPGKPFAVVDIDPALLINEEAQEPYPALLLKADVPKAQPHLLEQRLGKRCGDLRGVRFCLCHRNLPIHKQKSGLLPTLLSILSTYLYTIPYFIPLGKGKLHSSGKNVEKQRSSRQK